MTTDKNTLVAVLTFLVGLGVLVNCIIYHKLNVQEQLDKQNKELIYHQQKLVNYQNEMINSLEYTLWNEYNDDCAQFDGDEQYNINKEKNIIDSLYKSQL